MNSNEYLKNKYLVNNDKKQKENEYIKNSTMINKNSWNFKEVLVNNNEEIDLNPRNNVFIRRSHSFSGKSVETTKCSKYKNTSCCFHSSFEKQEFGDNYYLKYNSVKTPLKKQIKDSKMTLSTTYDEKIFSDMVFNMKKLSKNLDDTRIMLQIKNILVITKTHDKSLILLTRKLVIWLLSYQSNLEEKYSVYIDSIFKDYDAFDSENIIKSNKFFKDYLKYWTFELCRDNASLFDFIITLGGDGTVLFSSWLFQKAVPPVLSFSLGSLGFLTMFDFSMFDTVLDNIFNHGVIISLRMRFECTIMRVKVNDNGELVDKTKNLDRSIIEDEKRGMSTTHEPKESFSILNDLIVDRGPNEFLSSLELYGNYKHLTSIQADGICISTPTGSTAYSLSAGGPLCHPDIPAILISPICPHTLSFRPLLVHDSMILHIAVPYNARSTAWVSFDGRNRVEIKQGDYITISTSKFPFPIIHQSKQNFDWFTSLTTRLGWNERSMRPKPLSN